MLDDYKQVEHDYNELNAVEQFLDDRTNVGNSSIEYYPPGLNMMPPIRISSKHVNKVAIKRPTEKEFLDKLINDHWNYIEGVLQQARRYDSDIAEIKYHYKTAFSHGWKHHAEYLDAINTGRA